MERLNIVIIGATSAIAAAAAKSWASKEHCFYLVGRNEERLTTLQQDLTVRGAQAVHQATLDLNNLKAHPSLIEDLVNTLQHIDIVLIAHGDLADQTTCEQSVVDTMQALQTNLLSTLSLLTLLAQQTEALQNSTIAVIGSVAGDRGRASNYVYGTAKAALDTFTSGLRARLFKQHVHVLLIKPGFVDTPMTAHLNLPAALTAKPETVAKDIQRAISKQKNTVYTPWFWGIIAFIVRCLPTGVMKRLSF